MAMLIVYQFIWCTFTIHSDSLYIYLNSYFEFNYFAKKDKQISDRIVKDSHLHQVIYSCIVWFSEFSSLPRAYVESLKQREHTSLPFHVQKWPCTSKVQNTADMNDNRSDTDKVRQYIYFRAGGGLQSGFPLMWAGFQISWCSWNCI